MYVKPNLNDFLYQIKFISTIYHGKWKSITNYKNKLITTNYRVY